MVLGAFLNPLFSVMETELHLYRLWIAEQVKDLGYDLDSLQW